MLGKVCSEYLYVNRVSAGRVIQFKQFDYVGTGWFSVYVCGLNNGGKWIQSQQVDLLRQVC
jgi:hypothetical protein